MHPSDIDITAHLFNKAVSVDFTNLKNKLLLTGLRIRIVSVQYDKTGAISYAEFELENIGLTGTRFIYAPTKTLSDLSGDNENWYIEPGWYFQIEDCLWNFYLLCPHRLFKSCCGKGYPERKPAVSGS